MENNHYRFFFILLGLSLLVMYLVMFLNVDSVNHIYFSLSRLYMTLLMVCPMALIMMFFMRHMYNNRKINGFVIGFSILIFVVSFVCLRSQIPIGDDQYIKAMIPHHSSAIMTSKNAKFKDPEVRKLSKSIIESQEREIAQMKSILKRLRK